MLSYNIKESGVQLPLNCRHDIKRPHQLPSSYLGHTRGGWLHPVVAAVPSISTADSGLLCVFRCFFKWSERIKRFPHSGHANRFSPVCVRTCRWSSSERVKDLSQYIHVHVKGRSPACQRKWAFSWEVLQYAFRQPGTWQMCRLFFSPASAKPSASSSQFGHLHFLHLRVAKFCPCFKRAAAIWASWSSLPEAPGPGAPAPRELGAACHILEPQYSGGQ